MTLFSRMFKWDPITTDKIIQSSTLYPSPSFPKPLTFNKRFSIPLLCPTNSLSICTYVCLCYHIDAVIPPLKNQHILQTDQSRVGESNKTYLCHSLVQIFMTLFLRNSRVITLQYTKQSSTPLFIHFSPCPSLNDTQTFPLPHLLLTTPSFHYSSHTSPNSLSLIHPPSIPPTIPKLFPSFTLQSPITFSLHLSSSSFF